MTRLLFFDTETITFLNGDCVSQIKEDCKRLFRLAYILCDQNENIITSGNYIIKPDSFNLSEMPELRNGFSWSQVLREGVPLFYALSQFFSAVIRSDYIVSHGFDINNNIIKQEASSLGFEEHYKQMFLFKEDICTSCSTKELLKIPNTSGYKEPTLSELYNHLFNQEYISYHNILNNAFSCAKCFFRLKQKGYFTVYDDYVTSLSLNLDINKR